MTWKVDGPITSAAHEARERCLKAYRANPDLIEEHFGIEREISEGGYGRRQIYELVQNGADELLRAGEPGRIAVVLAPTFLYCANQGTAIDEDGVRAILGAHRSMKRGNEIGRFGVGFKSVLAVTNSPEFFSRSGSFRFDPQRARQDISRIQPNLTRVPKLRLSYPINPDAAADEDSVLSELMEWATTVVRLPLTEDGKRQLPEDVRSFPAEFMLFSRHVAELVLDDRTSGWRNTVVAERSGDSTTLVSDGPDGSSETEWRLFAATYRLTDAAREYAGELADRDELPLAWAVPTGSQDRGRFWAFFPTEYAMSLRGILNAPWKINADRQNLLRSEFNIELLGCAVDLVLDNLRHLTSADDPARHLDFMPGRGRESLQWADDFITKEVWDRSDGAELIPRLDASLVDTRTVKVPHTPVTAELMQRWSELPSAPTDWVHPSALTRERRAKIERILEAAGCDTVSVAEWLEAVIDGTPEASLEALRLAVEVRDSERPTAGESRGGNEKGSIRSARLLVTSSGQIVAADPNVVFFGDVEVTLPAGHHLVHPDLVQLPGAVDLLRRLGIRELDLATRIEAMLADPSNRDPGHWRQFWELLDGTDTDEVLGTLRRHAGRVRVQTIEGRFELLGAVLLPGEIVPGDGSRDAEFVVDTVFHERHLPLFEVLGLSDVPRLQDRADGNWFREYSSEAFSTFVAVQSGRRHPRQESVSFVHRRSLDHLDLLESLSIDGRLALTSAILRQAPQLPPWVMEHSNNTYATCRTVNPALWLVQRHGVVPTSRGPQPVAEAVGPSLSALSDVLPVAVVTETEANLLQLPGLAERIPARIWTRAIAAASRASHVETDPAAAADRLGRVLALACQHHAPKPATVEVLTEDGFLVVALGDLAVSSRRDDAEFLLAAGHPFVLAPSAELAELLMERWGCAPAIVDVTVRPANPASPTRALDRFPTLLLYSVPASVEIVECEDILVDHGSEHGSTTTSVEVFRSGDRLFVRDDLDESEILAALNDRFNLGIDTSELATIGRSSRSDSERQRRTDILMAESLEDKVLLAIGADQLRHSIPTDLMRIIEGHGAPDDHTIARLALAVRGVDLLKLNEEALRRAGLEPPSQWAGGWNERRWVSELGFPLEFAGRRSEGRDPVVEVPGRSSAPPLHPYQTKIVERMIEILKRGSGRGFISLPTGAGKTRVATHALTVALADRVIGPEPVLWVAETDELCEQAVQTWGETWRAEGNADTLTVCRLWTKNHMDPPAAPCVVVATIAKLATLFDQRSYDWLRDPAAVVIDEGHRALSPQYTNLLRWLGLDGGKDRLPLFGLSATPYRGTSEDETRRLSNRFFNVRLDDLGDDPYGHLQRLGVLATVEHRLLSGASVHLTDQELTRLTETRLVPSSVEERIASDVDRNTAIVESILALPPDVPVLLFGASVAHAELLAGLLTFHGVEARAVSATTPVGSRRHYIDQFRRGDIRVLTNYGVLTEGFDAPSIGAVYVARPTYSPNLYQQMIGRGLRGPLNGGKERCLIVNVQDNLVEYGENLAFYEFEHLWQHS